MKPNTQSKFSLPYRKDGRIFILGSTDETHDGKEVMTKVIIVVQGFFNIGAVVKNLRGYLNGIGGVEDSIVSKEAVVLQYAVVGEIRNPRGLLKSVRAKFDQAVRNCGIDAAIEAGDPNYSWLRTAREKATDAAELAALHDEEREEALSLYNESLGIDDEEGPREYCDLCGDPMDECVCGPVCPQCGQPEKECVCVEDEEEDN